MKTRKIYIILFIVLYVFVALVSGIHGFAFFGLANVPLLAIMLAIAFEVGQAAVLFSILTDESQRKKVMPWALMIIFTLVQIMGNVYNSYKYLITNSEANLRFFKEPIFTWIENMPDAQADVILSYIQGAILPICALLLTSMVAGFLTKKDEEIIEYVEEEPVEEEPVEEEPVEEEPVEEEPVEEEPVKEEPVEEEPVGEEIPNEPFKIEPINGDWRNVKVATNKDINGTDKDSNGSINGALGEPGDPSKFKFPQEIYDEDKQKQSHFVNLK